jgi:Dipeptidyl aminopeptidases/acylaminoacyl-peptidases
MKSIRSFVTAALVLAVVPAMAQKSIPLVYDQEFTGAKYAAPAFPTVSDAKALETLPNPFEFSNSKKQVKKFKDWEKRRAEIVRELQHYEIGEKPMVDKKDIEASLEGNTLTVKVTRNGETLTISAQITYPEGDGPFPLMIGASNNSLPRQFFTSRNIATMNFRESQVNSYSQMGGFGGGGQKKDRGDYEFDRLYPELVDNGAYSMWTWGVSRLIDGLEIVGAASKIDMKHIGITGCSYAGKMALWSGAMDERIALTIAQEPGGGGAAAWRVSQTLGKVENLGATDEHWFMKSMWDWKEENVSKLPYDHHELCALVCPRALLVLGNTDYEWLADEAGYVSCVAAREVWKKFGIEDRMGFSIQGKHGHCQLPQSQYPEVEAFIDKFLLGKEDANTIIMHVDETLKDKEVQKWIPWAQVDFK